MASDPTVITKIYEQIPLEAMQQVSDSYMAWYVDRVTRQLDDTMSSLRSELRDNDQKETSFRPSPQELESIERLQRSGVTGVDLLDRMVEQGDAPVARLASLARHGQSTLAARSRRRRRARARLQRPRRRKPMCRSGSAAMPRAITPRRARQIARPHRYQPPGPLERHARNRWMRMTTRIATRDGATSSASSPTSPCRQPDGTKQSGPVDGVPPDPILQ